MTTTARIPNPLANRDARRRTVRCPSCGDSRVVSLEHEIRIRNGKHSPLCSLCRTPAKITVGEEERRWWLRRYGVTDEMLAGRSSGRYVLEEGLPEELRPIAASAAAFFEIE